LERRALNMTVSIIHLPATELDRFFGVLGPLEFARVRSGRAAWGVGG
jgi:hypothetical protein